MNKKIQILDFASKEMGKKDFQGILLEIAPQNDKLVIACSGIVPANTIKYSLENTTTHGKHSKIFICDKNSYWYYDGIYGITKSFDETIDLIKNILIKKNFSFVCSIGTSAGGYMALAIASILDLNRALALSPQSTLDNSKLISFGDHRWKQKTDIINIIMEPYDIKNLINNAKKCNFHVIYSSQNILDTIHAKRLSDLKRVALYEYATNNHNVSEALNNSGLLKSCIDTVIDELDNNTVEYKIRSLIKI